MTIESSGTVTIIADYFGAMEEFNYSATEATQIFTDNMNNLHVVGVIYNDSMTNVGFSAGNWYHWRIAVKPIKPVDAAEIAAIDPHPAAVEAVQNIGPIRDKFDE